MERLKVSSGFSIIVLTVSYDYEFLFVLKFLLFGCDYFLSFCAEGVVIASSHPLITGGVAAGLGLTVLKSMVQSSIDFCIVIKLSESFEMCLFLPTRNA